MKFSMKGHENAQNIYVKMYLYIFRYT